MDDVQEKSFEALKKNLYEASILTLGEGMEDFMMYSDGSCSGLGMV